MTAPPGAPSALRLAVVSDVHGRTEGLAEAALGADLFVCLGDLILFLDYDDPGQGIFADVHGEAQARRYIELRTSGLWAQARDLSAALWGALEEQPWAVIGRAVERQYREVFAALPAGLITYGNVDVPAQWGQHLRPHHQLLDGRSIEVGGVRLGFVGGGLPSPMRTPYEIPEEEYDAKIESLGPVDVLFAHLPPALPELLYDVRARRFERGSQGLLRAVERWQPRYLFHGHVHNPLSSRTRVGRTEIVNVGHFRAIGRPLRVEVPVPAPAGTDGRAVGRPGG
jgi:Icc-related predicted phosphoesterase